MPHRRERGQAYALEGIIGAVIIVSALVLGLQAVDIAPWTDSDDRQTEELRVEVEDVLDAAQDSDALRKTVTCLADGEIHPNAASTSAPMTAFGEVLSETIAGNHQYRIQVDYPVDGEIATAAVDTRAPLPNQPTATVSRQIVLTDSDLVYEGETCDPRTDFEGDPVTVADLDDGDDNNDDIYLENQDEDSAVFAVIRVRVVAW